MKFGFLAMTDYQLLNIIKFVYTDCESSKKNSDLYICDSLSNFEKKKKMLINSELFKDVFKVQAINFPQNIIMRKVKSFYLTFNRNAFLGMVEPNAVNKIREKKYDVMVVACSMLQCEIFYSFFSHQYLYFIEDGLGSYFGNIQNTTMTKQRKFFIRLLGRKETIHKMYVNKIDFGMSNVTTNIFQIPGIEEENYLNLLRRVFLPDYYCETYKSRDLIFLRQPLYDFKMDSIIHKLYLLAGDRLVIREHPQNMGMKKDEKYRYDLDNNMWECVCLDNISNQNCLIGMFSTAQITPKILFNLEPIVIFLFMLFPLEESEKEEQMEIYHRFKNLYCCKEKVLLPETEEELLSVIEELL